MTKFSNIDEKDELFKRYRISWDLVKDLEEVTYGDKIPKKYTENVGKNYDKDLKKIDIKKAKFEVFQKKERKHQIRLEKLGFGKFVKNKGFVEVGPEDVDEDLSTKKKRKRFDKRCRKYYKENRRFIKVIRKYRIYLPKDLYVEPEEVVYDVEWPVNVEPKDVSAEQENEAQGASGEPINIDNDVTEDTAGDTALSATDDGVEAPATVKEEKAEEENGETLVENESCEVEEKGTDEKLGAFFGEDEDCGEEKETTEEVNEENLDLQKTG